MLSDLNRCQPIHTKMIWFRFTKNSTCNGREWPAEELKRAGDLHKISKLSWVLISQPIYWWLPLSLEAVILYLCLMVYVAQIHVHLSSRGFWGFFRDQLGFCFSFMLGFRIPYLITGLSGWFIQKERDKAEVSTWRGGTGASCVRPWLTRNIV